MNQPPQVNLEHHRRLRAILRGHQNAAVQTVPRTALRTWARRFGLAEGNNLLLESEGELVILFDFLIYHHRQWGRTLAQKYLAKLPPTDDWDELLVRRAMASPRFSAFELKSLHPSLGLEVRDVVRGGTAFVADEALSTSARPGWFLALRLLPMPDYWMTSGGGFPLSREAVQNVRRLLLPALRRLRGKDLAHLSPEAEDRLAAFVTGAAMEEGTTGDIEFRWDGGRQWTIR